MSTSSGSGSQSQLFAIFVQVSHLESLGLREEFPYSSLASSSRAAVLESADVPTDSAMANCPLDWSIAALIRGKSFRFAGFMVDLAGGGRFLLGVGVFGSPWFLSCSTILVHSSLCVFVIEAKIREPNVSQQAGASCLLNICDTAAGPASLILLIEHQPCDARMGSRQLQSLAPRSSLSDLKESPWYIWVEMLAAVCHDLGPRIKCSGTSVRRSSGWVLVRMRV